MDTETSKTPPMSTSPQPSGNKSHFLMYAGISIVVFACLIGAFFLGKKTGTPAQVVPTPLSRQIIPTSITSPIIYASPTVFSEIPRWQAYPNEIIGYTINIPADWRINSTEGVFISVKGEVGFFPPGEEDSQPYKTAVYIVSLKDGEMNRYNLDSEAEFTEWLNRPASNDRSQRQFKVGQIKVDGIDAVQYVTQALSGDPTEAYYGLITWFRKNGYNYYIEMTGDKNVIPESLYNQIVSTFKFTK